MVFLPASISGVQEGCYMGLESWTVNIAMAQNL
jgi:hypothetical protein